MGAVASATTEAFYPLKPLQPVRKRIRRKLEMQHPSVSRSQRRRRSMEDQWTHHEDPSRSQGTNCLRDQQAFRDRFIAEPPLPMRSANHSKRSVLLPAIIQVNTQRNHSLENFSRRMHMRNAGFHRPSEIPRGIDLRTHGNRRVLMPAKRPIGTGRFVEEQHPRNKCILAQDLPGNRVKARRASKLPQCRDFIGDIASPGTSHRGTGSVKRIPRRPQLFLRERVLNKSNTILINPACECHGATANHAHPSASRRNSLASPPARFLRAIQAPLCPSSSKRSSFSLPRMSS
jgi:hypothetical protein